MMVRYVGFLSEDSGYGQAARSHLDSLRLAHVPVSPRAVTLLDKEGFRELPPPLGYRRKASQGHDRVVVHVPPMVFWLFREADHPNVGVAACETQTLPSSWRRPLEQMDELWVPSRFCADAFEATVKTRVRVVPHPVRPVASGPHELAGIPSDTFLFLSLFEWSDRKNPTGLLSAFLRAFSGRSDVALLLKVGTRFAKPSQILRTLRSYADRPGAPPIYATFEALSQDGIARLYRRADAYVSLHRAEGFGLTLAEAMVSGKPVVATAYSGNLEYMSDDAAFLVEHRLVPIREALTRTGLYADGLWAEPVSSSAIEALRACADNAGERARRARRGCKQATRLLDPERIGARMRQYLDALSTPAS